MLVVVVVLSTETPGLTAPGFLFVTASTKPRRSSLGNGADSPSFLATKLDIPFPRLSPNSSYNLTQALITRHFINPQVTPKYNHTSCTRRGLRGHVLNTEYNSP
jgi:hypothetical protein